MSINENREFYVYEHIRLDNMTCFYVGKGKGERAYNLERNDHHDRISNKYGHAVLIIKDNLTEEEAFELERDTIEDYVFNLGYGIDIIGFNNKEDHEIGHLTNCTWGGEGINGIQLSEETKQRMSESHKGKHNSEETKKKMSESKKGIQLSEEHKQKLSELLKGRQFSEETKKKLSKSLKGRQFSEEHKQKLSKSLKGRQLSEEHKQKLSESLKGRQFSEEHKQKLNKKVICITTCKIFDCIKDAGNYYNVAKNTISLCCKGKLKSAGKLSDRTPLKWKYVKDYNNDFKGIQLSEEHKQKISEAHKGKYHSDETKQKLSKKVVCVTTGKIFNSQKEASNYYKCSHISDCCKGILKSAGKLPDGTPLQWKYVKDYNNDFKGILIKKEGIFNE